MGGTSCQGETVARRGKDNATSVGDNVASRRNRVVPFSSLRVSRDTILFFGGLAGAAHETLADLPDDRPHLVILFAAMMGLPAFLRADERKQEERE